MKRIILNILLFICYLTSAILIIYVVTTMSMLINVLSKLNIEPSILVQCNILIIVSVLLAIIGSIIYNCINFKTK